MKISSKLLRIIRQGRSFLIVCHVNPEGDAIGSVLALALGLRKMGKKDIFVLSKDGLPETLKFLPSSGLVKQTLPDREFDVLCLVDCNTLERTGFKELQAKNTIIIDHHILTDAARKSEFHRKLSAGIIDSGAAAAGLITYNLLAALRISIDKNIAVNLYTAILVDTGGFKYSNVSPESLEVASHLVKAGARPWEIAKEVYENISFRSMELLGLSLATLDSKDGIAWISTTMDMFNKTGARVEDTEDFVEFPRKIRDIEAAVFFREDRHNLIKISLRSKGSVNVERVANSFGGGGHAAAAGCRIEGSLREAQNKIFKAIKKELRKQ